MAKKIKLRRSFGTLGKLFTIIPDTTELIGKGMENTRPIIEKYMDQRQKRLEGLKTIDDVINLPVDDAEAHLEKQGFVVATIPAKPNKKWLEAGLNEVVSMSPRAGKHKIGSLIKLYYVNLDVLEKSQSLLEEDNLKIVERNQKISDTLDTVKHIKIPFGKK
ncbi:PASTA domain-containing protein [Streptococcus didelphis]|uniref:PASTA domain-containing protein n=1 Tax=Streptococcus didelphis TaxID=102886 RepID=A0ABY9LHD4_9STRE|nr:PASTA domain-containing protein [Streptococcus didelphis]WMB28280.1 PASTA domain-containing protein [Streptococcus didelphis]WMB28951.1 PASTA domain-containing protein [Streptococcus didelphis]